MNKEENQSDKRLETNEKWIIGATLILFAMSFILTAVNAPKRYYDTVDYSISSSGLSNISSDISSENRISSSDLEMLLKERNRQKQSGQADSSAATLISGKININTATSEQLQTLSGIGEARAVAIIEYRNTYGAFSSIEDIINVNGIGEKTYEKIKDYITV